MLNENAVKLLKSGLWDLATCMDGEPNVVPVAFKDVTPEAGGGGCVSGHNPEEHRRQSWENRCLCI